jgi:hypothetical protein
MVKTIGQLSKGANKRTKGAATKRIPCIDKTVGNLNLGQKGTSANFPITRGIPGLEGIDKFIDDVVNTTDKNRAGSAETQAAQSGKGVAADKVSISPEADDLNINPDSTEEAQPIGPTSFERHLADIRRNKWNPTPEELQALDEKCRQWRAAREAARKAGVFDRIAVFHGSPDKLRDSSGEIVETIPRVGGDMQRALTTLQKQVEDAEAAVRMAPNLTVKKRAKTALQTAQRLLRNALDGSMLSAMLTIEKSVRKYLRSAKAKGWVRDYNEADVEDLISEAWIEQHSEEAILRCLEKAGLERTPENIERAHQMITEELKDPKVSALVARRAAEHWKDEKRRLSEVSHSTVLGNSDGFATTLQDVLTVITAVTGKDGEIVNDRLTPEQAAEEERYPIAYADTEALRIKAAELLKPADLEWLLRYQSSKGAKGAHSAADRQKCWRLMQKDKTALTVESKETVTGNPI